MNIGRACKLFQPYHELVILQSETILESMEELERYYCRYLSKDICRVENRTEKDKPIALAISGKSIEQHLTGDTVDRFFHLAEQAASVIIFRYFLVNFHSISRATPLQKCLVVTTVKRKTGKITLAIGRSTVANI